MCILTPLSAWHTPMTEPSDREILDTLAAAIRSGRRLSVPASGVSMGVAFQGVDAIEIRSADGVRLFPGRVIVYQRYNRWIAHRVMWAFGPSSEYLCITKGDGVQSLDHPFVRREECVGVVVASQQGSRTRNLESPTAHALGIWKVVVGLAKMRVCAILRQLRTWVR